MEKKEKIFVGLCKGEETQYGLRIKISLPPQDIEKLNAEFSRKNGGWVNLVLKQRKEVSPKGYTHSIEVDQWEPNVPKKQDVGTDYFKDASRTVTPDEVEMF